MNLIRIAEKSLEDKNTKVVVVNIICSFGIKGLSMFIGFFTTPVYITYFNNNEILGIWFTLLSVLAWILNCDMGIGNGLRNKLVEAIERGKPGEVKKYISSAYLFSFGISVGVILVIVGVSQFINWNVIFNIAPEVLPSSDLTQALTILIAGICLQLILRLIVSILYALQRAFVPSLLNLITNVIMLVFAYVATQMNVNGSIINMAWVYLIAVNVPLFIATFYVFGVTSKEMAPSVKFYEKKYAMSILKLGGIFLWLQLMIMLLNGTNSYLVTIFIGNTAVVEFNIYNKIFTLIGTFVGLGSTPIWSATTKAQVEKNYKWLYSLFKKFAGISILGAVAGFLLIIPLQQIFNVWLGDNTIQVDYSVALLFAIFGSVVIWSTTISSFVNGLGELRLQFIFLTLGAVINIPLTYVLVQVTRSYIAIVIANIVAFLPYVLIQTVWLVKYLKSKVSS